MRIIAGVAKGRRLVGPPGLDTRPLTDRAKEALFSSLGPAVVDAAVLDLFAGSGSLGLEALSRGAGSVVFVERDWAALKSLEENCAAVGLGGEVRREDVHTYLLAAGGPFDLVFVDPPYAMDPIELDGILSLVAGIVALRGQVVVHRRAGSDAPEPPEDLRLQGQRRYGDVELWRFIKEET